MDFTQTYGVRLDTMRDEAGAWPWARDHILGLLGTDTRLTRVLRRD